MKSQVHSAETARLHFKLPSGQGLVYTLLLGDKTLKTWKVTSTEWQPEKSLYKNKKSPYKVCTARVPFECKFINQEVSDLKWPYQRVCVQVCLRVSGEQVIFYETSLLFTQLFDQPTYL